MCISFSFFVPPTPPLPTEVEGITSWLLSKVWEGWTARKRYMMIMVSLSLYKHLNLAVAVRVHNCCVWQSRNWLTDWLAHCCWVLKWINIYHFSMNLSKRWQLDVMCEFVCQIKSDHNTFCPPNVLNFTLIVIALLRGVARVGNECVTCKSSDCFVK